MATFVGSRNSHHDHSDDIHSFEAAARVIYTAALGNNKIERLEWLRSAFEACCQHKKFHEDLEVWFGMIEVRLMDNEDAMARIQPIVKAASIAFPNSKKITFEQLHSLVLFPEALHAEEFVNGIRLKLRGLIGTNGAALLKYLLKENDVQALTYEEVFHAFLQKKELKLNIGCALILAERLDINHDGLITIQDAATWLTPPRSVQNIRNALAIWVSKNHFSSPRQAFDALDHVGAGLLARNSFLQFDATLTEPELDALFLSIDDDGSGCISHNEFCSWLIDEQNEVQLRQEDEVNTSTNRSSSQTQKEDNDHKSGVFAAAAAQLREALIERCSSSANHTLSEKLRIEFEKIDKDNSGGISIDEFTHLLESIGVEVITTTSIANKIKAQETRHLINLSLPNTNQVRKNPFQAVGISIEERIVGHRGCDRTLFVRHIHNDSCDIRERDEIISVCGTTIPTLAAELDYDQCYIDRSPMDALTRKVEHTFIENSILSNDRESIQASLTVRRLRTASVSRAQLEILLKGMDEDNDGTISLDEINHFVLDAPEEGEAELSLVIAAIREQATKLGDSINGHVINEEACQQICVSLAARAFVALNQKYGTLKGNHHHTNLLTAQAPVIRAALTVPHALKCTVIKRWLNDIQLDAGQGRITKRQVALILDRLDANGDGVISRSEFDAWAFPQRSLDDIIKLLQECVMNEPFQGNVVQFHERLRGSSRSDDIPINRIEFARNILLIGCPLKSSEIQVLLDAVNKKNCCKRLPLKSFAELLGFDSVTVDQFLRDRVSMPTTVVSRPAIIEAKRHKTSQPPFVAMTKKTHAAKSFTSNKIMTTSNSSNSKKKKFVQMTPEDLARTRALQKEKQIAAAARRDIPPLSNDAFIDIEESLIRLQARARSQPCRSIHQALYREAKSQIMTETALLEVAALKLELSDARSRFTARSIELEARHQIEIAERDTLLEKAQVQTANLRLELESRESQMRQHVARLKKSNFLEVTC